jgi:hypothetical protein
MNWYLNATSVAPDGLTQATGYHSCAALIAARGGAGDGTMLIGEGNDQTIWLDNSGVIDDSAADLAISSGCGNVLFRSCDEAAISTWKLHTGGAAGLYFNCLGGAVYDRIRHIHLTADALSSLVITGSRETANQDPHVYRCLFTKIMVIMYNTDYGRICSNIFAGSYAGAPCCVGVERSAAPFACGCVIAGNTFYNTQIGGLNCLISVKGVTAGNKIKNNIFHTINSPVVKITAPVAPVLLVIRKNIDHLCTAGTYVGDAAACADASNKSVDPLMTNPAGGDFTIGYDSPAFNAGERQVDDPDMPFDDYDGGGRQWYDYPCIGAYETENKDGPMVWVLVNAIYTFEVEYAATIEALLTDPAFTGTRHAWIVAFLAEFTAMWTQVQALMDESVACLNLCRVYFGLAPLVLAPIAGANHKAKCFDWGTKEDVLMLSYYDLVTVAGSFPAGQKTDAYVAIAEKVVKNHQAMESIAWKYSIEINGLKTII